VDANSSTRPPDVVRKGEDGLVTEESALRIAHERIKDDIVIPTDCKPEISVKDDKYVITYPFRLAPGWRGPDYHAKVTVDARTGEILEVLAAP
jgi:predicted small secreted protein